VGLEMARVWHFKLFNFTTTPTVNVGFDLRPGTYLLGAIDLHGQPVPPTLVEQQFITVC
jgi:hypothetical protein